MNLYLISYLDSMVQQNIAIFCKMNFVKTAVFLSDFNPVSLHLKSIADFYFEFFHQINFLSDGVSVVDYIVDSDLATINYADSKVTRILKHLSEKDLTSKDMLPVHIRYSADGEIHLVAGVLKLENRKIAFMHLVDLHIPRGMIKSMPNDVSYVREILESYDLDNKSSLRNLVAGKGFNYNQFQKDCKTYFGDTFYSFLLKKKIVDAVADIVFTRMRLKEVAFKNKFIDYPNMYKIFLKYGVSLPTIPRLAITN